MIAVVGMAALYRLHRAAGKFLMAFRSLALMFVCPSQEATILNRSPVDMKPRFIPQPFRHKRVVGYYLSLPAPRGSPSVQKPSLTDHHHYKSQRRKQLFRITTTSYCTLAITEMLLLLPGNPTSMWKGEFR